MMYCVPIWEFVPPISDAATPATPARPDPTKKVMRSTVRVEIAAGLGEVPVLDGRPDPAAERGVLEPGRQGGDADGREHDGEHLPQRPA